MEHLPPSQAAWFYPDPTPPFRDLKDRVALYPSKMDACWVDGEKFEAQPGYFYGGWTTPGTQGW
jgi:hypothetical protein